MEFPSRISQEPQSAHERVPHSSQPFEMSLRSDLLLAVATLACCASALQGNGPATRVITEPAISRHALPLGAAEPAISRRALMLGAAAAALLPGPHRATAANELPPAVVMLRVAEVTDFQEAMMRRSARDTEDERRREGLEFGRPQMIMSTDILLRNTKLGSLPGCAAPALTLGGVKRIANVGEGALSSEELLMMASQYAKARAELRVAFEALPAEEQREGKEIARRLRAEDDARKRQAADEALKEALYGRVGS